MNKKIISNLFLIVIPILIFIACKETAEPNPLPAPKADFSWTISNDGNVQFENKSVGASSYVWTFDGNTATSKESNPKYRFSKNGTFEVTLTASNASGSDKKATTILINNIIPIASSKISLDKFVVPCNLTVNGSNATETTKIRVLNENKTEIASSTSQDFSYKLSNSGLYVIEYSVSNVAGSATKIDSIIIFENSTTTDFYEVKLKELPVKIRKSNADKIANQPTFLYLFGKIDRMKSQVPNWAYDAFKKITLWVDDGSMPNYTAVYHPAKAWLIQNGYMEAKALGVELSNLTNFVNWSKSLQVDILLHEYSHAYHHQVMVNGYNNNMILDTYNASMASKKYESVDYLGGGKQKHYGTSNQQEYFAEMTEAYFGKNDFYPFIRSELKSFDVGSFNLMEKVWVNGMKNN